MRKVTRDKQKRRDFVGLLIKGNADPEAMAKAMRTSVDEVARMATDRHVVRVVASLRELTELQAILTLSRYRIVAADRLARLTDDGCSETARKASTELLRFIPRDTSNPPTRDDDDPDGDERVDEALLKLLSETAPGGGKESMR